MNENPKNIDWTHHREMCPVCRAPEVSVHMARTVYACGSSTYDARPGTLRGPCAKSTPPGKGWRMSDVKTALAIGVYDPGHGLEDP